ncbi:hypothetical protein PHMEG_00040559, partial [Phytophthora megakarya]
LLKPLRITIVVANLLNRLRDNSLRVLKMNKRYVQTSGSEWHVSTINSRLKRIDNRTPSN